MKTFCQFEKNYALDKFEAWYICWKNFIFVQKLGTWQILMLGKDSGEKNSTMLWKHLRQFWKLYAALQKYKVWVFLSFLPKTFGHSWENLWCLNFFDILVIEESFHLLHFEKNPNAWKIFGQFWEFLCYPITMGKLLKLKKTIVHAHQTRCSLTWKSVCFENNNRSSCKHHEEGILKPFEVKGVKLTSFSPP